MHNRRKALDVVAVVIILMGLGLVGVGIYYSTTPAPPFMVLTSADRQAAMSSKQAAESLEALSAMRPWDPVLADGARKAREEAAREERARARITTALILAGAVLGALGGVRIAVKRKAGAVTPTNPL